MGLDRSGHTQSIEWIIKKRPKVSLYFVRNKVHLAISVKLFIVKTTPREVPKQEPRRDYEKKRDRRL
jgi:hypothetical protein